MFRMGDSARLSQSLVPVLTMESLRDLTSDLSNVRRDELKRFATEQGWAIPKKSTLREGMIDYLVSPLGDKPRGTATTHLCTNPPSLTAKVRRPV